MKLVVAVVLVCGPVLAHADPQARVATATQYDGPPGGELDAPPVVDVPPPPPVAPIELARDRAVASRGLLVGTALTVPEGHVEVTGRTLVPIGALAAISAGLTPTTEVWADTGAVFDLGGDDEGLASAKTYAFGAKQVIVREHTWQLAVTGSVRRVEVDRLYAASAVASACTDESCATLVTVSGGFATANDHTTPMIDAGLLTGSGAFHAAAEVMWLGEAGLGVLGGRIGGSNLALDLGVGFVLAKDTKVVPLPILGLAVRI